MDRKDSKDPALHGVTRDGDMHSGSPGGASTPGDLFRAFDLSQLGNLGNCIQKAIELYDEQHKVQKQLQYELNATKTELAQSLAENQELRRQQVESRTGDDGLLPPIHELQIDITDFCTDDMKSVRQLFLALNRLVQTYDANGYVVQSAEYVVPVYYFLHRQCHQHDHSWCFHGSRSNFVRYWNMYVAGIQADEERRQQLRLRPDSFAALVGKYRILNCHPRTWSSVYRSTYRHRRVINAACNVRTRLRTLLFISADA